MPEVKNDMIFKTNPMNFDLYRCAFEEGGELAVYASFIRKRLVLIREEQIKKEKLFIEGLQVPEQQANPVKEKKKQSSKRKEEDPFDQDAFDNFLNDGQQGTQSFHNLKKLAD